MARIFAYDYGYLYNLKVLQWNTWQETRKFVTLIVSPDISSRHLYMFEANYKPRQNVARGILANTLIQGVIYSEKTLYEVHLVETHLYSTRSFNCCENVINWETVKVIFYRVPINFQISGLILIWRRLCNYSVPYIIVALAPKHQIRMPCRSHGEKSSHVLNLGTRQWD
jgi:hypothetical protein